MNEIIFEVTQEEDGGFCAECLTESIFTQGDTWEELRQNVQEAVRGCPHSLSALEQQSSASRLANTLKARNFM